MRGLLLPLLLLGFAAQADAQVIPNPEAGERLPTDAELAELLADAGTTAADAYEIGVRFFEAKNYESAETAWLRAHALGGDPKLLVAIADTRQRREDEPGAVAMLMQYLAARPDAPDRPSIEARIATLLQSPAVLIVRSLEPGHAILLDGAPVEKKTPAELEVEPGTHTVLVFGEGKQVGEETVQVGYGEVKELDFTPETTSQVIVEDSKASELQARLVSEQQDTTIRRAVISTGSIAAASLLTGTVLGVLALKKEQSYDSSPSMATADQGERLALFADLAFGITVLAAVTSFTLFMTHKNKRKRERETAHLRIDSRGAGATATLRF